MNEEIHALEKVITELKARVAAAAQEPFELNGYEVEFDVEPDNRFIEILVDGEYVGGGNTNSADLLARLVAKRCGAGDEVVADIIDRFNRAAGL